MALKVHLVCIDDQNDFTNPNGALYVKGADENVKRIARMIERLKDKLSDITLTMDSHHKVDISHPMWFVDNNGNPPAPFTNVSLDGDQIVFVDLAGNKTPAHTRKLGAQERTVKYLKALAASKRYPHTIWPEHCLIGDEGHNIAPVISAAVHGWEEKRYAMSEVLTKGSNPWTEHFSAVKAEVPDPNDPSTQINQNFVQAAMNCDIMLWVGEALSHCLANTFRDTVENFPDPSFYGKMVILTDATSPVDFPVFHQYADAFLRDMKAKGVKTSTTTDILA